jgi:hypothetical protein
LIKYSSLPKPTAHYEKQMKKGTQKAVLLTSSPYKDHQKLTKEKQNNKELKQQEKHMKKGKMKKRGTPATEEFGSEVVIEVNHEKWISMLSRSSG